MKQRKGDTNMKRKLYSVFSVILSILLVFSLVSCNDSSTNAITTGGGTTDGGTTDGNGSICNHRWSDANCTNPKTCFLCGATEGDASANGHAYLLQNDTYICIYCGTDAPCSHVEGEDTCPHCGETSLNKIKNVIYIIGDGMGLEHIAAGQLAYNKDYLFEDWQFASVNTDSLTPNGRNQSELTDSAAAGTALATGVVTLNGYVGKDQHGADLQTVLDYAKAQGKRTGIISTDYLYGATPASFSAHCNDRNKFDEILASQITSNVDLLCGQYSETNSLSADVITQNGYVDCQSLAELTAQAQATSKLYCTLDMEETSLTSTPAKLSNVTLSALNYLDQEDGFVLMIEQAHVDKASHNNDFKKMVQAVNSLNDTVNAILDWLGDRTDTAIIITADHETGDLSVSGSKTLPHSAQIENNPTVYYRFNSSSHTKSNVGLFIYGADVNIEKSSYFNTPYTVKNSDIYKIACRLILDLR